jgi:hypothetical protein
MRARTALSGLLALALLGAGLQASAQDKPPVITSASAEERSLTIYQDPGASDYYDGSSGLALVTEWRLIDLPAGESRIRFRDVAEGLVPTTAAIDGLPAELLERNQDYDLLSPGSLIAASLGMPVTRVRTNPRTGAVTEERAILRSGPRGVMLEIDGRFEALNCSGEPERLVFDRAPDHLADKPTLSMLVRAPKAGQYRVRLTYLTVGVSWRANYVAKVNADGRTYDLTGWITLTNTSGTTFAEAPTAVVAGELERSYETRATVASVKTASNRCWPFPTGDYEGGGPPPPPPPPPPAPMAPPPPVMATQDVPVTVTGSRIPEQTELGDYKLYTLPWPTAVAARQEKQVLMLAQTGVPYDRVYRWRTWAGAQWEADTVENPDIMLRAQNRKDQGLGLPLPGGEVMVMEPGPSSAWLIAGETSFNNNAIGAPLDIELDGTGGVEVRPRLVTNKARGKRRTDLGYAVDIRNLTGAPAKVEVFVTDSGAVRFRRSSVRPVTLPGGRALQVTLAPGESRTVTYDLTVER